MLALARRFAARLGVPSTRACDVGKKRFAS
jgi:hypothetical protein